MPRLAEAGVVGADAIFACLGPALEIFSRHSRVEKASGEQVTLNEYLEQVWAAVPKEALNMIFEGGDATGFEEDARLTAMWLWTLSPGANGNGSSTEETEDEENEEARGKSAKTSGFVLEYDAARKISQGLGAHLEDLGSLVEAKGDVARLLPLSDRVRALFGKDEAQGAAWKRRKRDPQLQLGFMQALEQSEDENGWGKTGAPAPRETTLDRVHQGHAALCRRAG
jgi:putative DNA methylase